MTRDGRDASSIKDGMVYDNRNLLIEMTLHNTVTGMGAPVTEIRKLLFDYDEAGNRVRKREYLYQAVNPDPGLGDGGSGTTGTWNLVGDEYYSRDISGKEIAIYHSNDLYQWNVWGTDNIGKITANGNKFFYLKDHLGTIRVVLDASNNIVSANDYDCWGYPLENRSYQSNNTDYKFTGKQRDKESGYDYFGARYYDARIGRWGGVEKFESLNYNYSPYSYSKLNPISFIDYSGLYPKITQDGTKITIEATYYYLKDGKNGLSETEELKLKGIIDNMNEWKGNFEDEKGTKYEFIVKVKMEAVSGDDFEKMKLDKVGEGSNFIKKVDKVENSRENQGIAHDIDGSILYIDNNLSSYSTTGAHEFGHCLGLFQKEMNTDNSKIPSIMQPVDIYRNEKKEITKIQRNNPEANDKLEAYKTLKANGRLK